MLSGFRYFIKHKRIVRRFFILASIVLLSISAVICANPPSIGQTTSQLERVFERERRIPTSRPSVQIFQLGNLEYANVRLDGISLFQVAAEVNLTIEEGELRPIEKRVIRIENNLQQIVGSDFNPNALEVDLEVLDDELAILVEAKPNLPKQVVLEVTELDAQLAGQSISSLANARSEDVLTGILSAKLERQEENIIQKARESISIILVAVSICTAIAFIQRKLLNRWKKAKQAETLNQEATLTPNRSGFDTYQSGLVWPHISTFYPSHFQSLKIGRLNSLIRLLLRLLQIVVLVASISWIFNLFPYTRGFGRWLFGLPLRILGLTLLTIIVVKIISYFVDLVIEAWIDKQAIVGISVSRQIKRAPSIALASKQMIGFIAYLSIVIFFFVEIFQLPTISILTGAGIASLSLQSLFRDWINGIMILLEDQYALGDVVTIEEQTGVVEYLTLRVTKLRSLDGELISIANSRISKINNLTSDWSRINLGINVEYNTNLEQAISVIKSVAVGLQKDPKWSQLVIENPLVLGVDEFGQDYITIRVLIKTLPMRHWDVAREYRFRLKLAFEEAGISFSFPLKTIKMEPNISNT